MGECNKCSEFGLCYVRSYDPVDFLEGRPSSLVWIVGLNPAAEQNWKDTRSEHDLKYHLDDSESLHSYFKDFKKVSPRLFSMFGKENGVAHTDLVKCASKKWPPDSCKGKKAKIVISNCRNYLVEQISIYKPKLIICNGAPVSHEMQTILKPIESHETYYLTEVDGAELFVVLSGFIGRIDNFSRRRLGIEIEQLLDAIECR